jgi:hypothetical protein
MAMAENVLEKPICSACGADVRPQALFCYNCGSSVAPEIKAETNHENNADGLAAKTGLPETFDKPIEMPTDALIGKGKPENNSAAATAVQDRANLKSAAALRREKAKINQSSRKKIEVVWEEPGDGEAPNIWFILAALVLTLISVGILVAVLYIK